MSLVKKIENFVNENYVREPRGFLLNPEVKILKIIEGVINKVNIGTEINEEADNNSGVKSPSIEEIIRGRNKQILGIFKNLRFDINQYLHPITGAPFLKRADLKEPSIPLNAKDFFQTPGNLLDGGGRILSGRGRNYYFQFPGIEIIGNPLLVKDLIINQETSISGINHQSYCNSILEHYHSIRNIRFDWSKELHPNPTNLSDASKRGLLILLDHEKNILLFLINALTILLDPKFLNMEASGKLIFNKEQARSLILQNPNGFNEFKILRDEIFSKGNCILYKLYFLLSMTESDYSSLLERNFLWPKEPIGDIEINEVVSLLEKFLTFLNTAVQNGKKNSKKRNTNWDLYWETGVSKVVRFSREEDDIRSIKLTSVAMAKNIIDNYGRYSDLEIFGILYGGAELPFVLEESLTRLGFRGKITVRLATYSIYDVKNKTPGFTIDDYPAVKLFDWEWRKPRKIDKLLESIADQIRYFIGWEKTLQRGTYALVLDDNIFSGDTLLGFEKLLQDSGKYDAVVSQVTTLMIDSRKEKGMKQDKGLLLEKLPYAGNALPVWGDIGKKYSNPLSTLVGKRVEGNK